MGKRWGVSCGWVGEERGRLVPIVVPFFSGAEGSGVASEISFWSVCSGCLMLSSSFSEAMVIGILIVRVLEMEFGDVEVYVCCCRESGRRC